MTLGQAARALLFALLVALAATTARAGTAAPGDRWMEFDLYWFNPDRPEDSSREFWQRYAPLYRDVEGHRGLVLSVGLTVDFIMDWSGTPTQTLWLPRGTGREIGLPYRGQLEGTTAERQEAWRRRFDAHVPSKSANAEKRWTYGQLRQVVQALKREGERHGVRNFKVAALTVAHIDAYGEKGPFARTHSEAWTRWGKSSDPVLDSAAYFDGSARLKADPMPRGGLPDGIADGLPVHRAFGAQWGAVSRYLGLDGLMLRDSFGLPRAYTRYGPYGDTLPSAAHAERLTSGIETLLLSLKQGNRSALLMMYSSAATATSDWRANGLDLERVARGGNLDIFVDQSWGGAWGEVGVRRQTFWNAPILGWTFQLQYYLQHAAVLAGSRVRHYPLFDTFDAWESWDTIHTAPGRLKWAIWAMSHAAVKTPSGLDVADGSYISWGHHGPTLLDEADVRFLAGEIGAAARDAAAMADVDGPTLVYARNQLASEVQALPKISVRDRIDESAGAVAKWPVPILSITRLEWLPQVRADLFLFGPTDRLSNKEAELIVARAQTGQPIAFFASLSDGLHPRLAELAGVSRIAAPSRQDRRLEARLTSEPRASGVPRSFETTPPAGGAVATAGTAIAYSFGVSAALLRKQVTKLDIVLWDPVPLADYWYRPMSDLLNGHRAPFVLAADALNAQLADAGKVSADIDSDQPVAMASWLVKGRRRMILLGNLEEGLSDRSERERVAKLRVGPRRCTMRVPAQQSLLLDGATCRLATETSAQ